MTWGKRFVSALGSPYSRAEAIADAFFFVGGMMVLWPDTTMDLVGFPDGSPVYAVTAGSVLSAGALFGLFKLWSRR